MTQFIKKYKWFLISIFIPCLIVISLSVIKVKKDVTVPSTVNSIENIITINGESKLNGSINVVSVYSYEKVSLLSYLFASCNRYAQIDDNIEYTNIDSKKIKAKSIEAKGNNVEGEKVVNSMSGETEDINKKNGDKN